MNKKTLALWGIMAATPFLSKAQTVENPANFKEVKTTNMVDHKKTSAEKSYILNEKEVKKLIANQLEKGKGDPEKEKPFVESNFEDVQNIIKAAESSIEDGEGKKLKKLKLSEYGLFKDPEKEVKTFVSDLISKLETAGEKYDKFKEGDLEYNLSNTYISREIANYLSDTQVSLEGANDFVEKAIYALNNHEDLIVLDENSNKFEDQGSDGMGLIDPVSFDTGLKENVFNIFNGNKLSSAKRDLNNISQELTYVKIDLNNIFKKLTSDKKELDRISRDFKDNPKDKVKKELADKRLAYKELKLKLADKRLAYKKLKLKLADKKAETTKLETVMENFSNTADLYEKLMSKKAEIQSSLKILENERTKKQESQDYTLIEKISSSIKTMKNEFDIMKSKMEFEFLPRDLAQLVNNEIDNIEDNNEKSANFIKNYKEKRKEALNYLVKNFLEKSDKKILSQLLTGDPYNLAEKKEDLDGAILILGKYVSENKAESDYITDDVKGMVRRIKSRQGEFEDIDKALKVLNKTDRKSIQRKINDHIDSEIAKKKIESKKNKLTKEEEETIEKDAGRYYLDQINLYIKYDNAEKLLDKLNNLSKKSEKKENLHNIFEQEERIRKKSLAEAFINTAEKIDYDATEQKIEENLYTKQPKIRKDISKYLGEEIENTEEAIVSTEIDDLLKKAKDLMGEETDEEGESTEKDKKTIETDRNKKFKDNQEKAKKHRKEKEKEMRKSKNEVLGLYKKYETAAAEAINNNYDEADELEIKKAEAEKALADRKKALEEVKEAYEKTIAQFNRLTVKTDGREDHDNRLDDVKKLLRKAQKGLIEKEREVIIAYKNIHKNEVQLIELEKKESENISKTNRLEQELGRK